MTISTRRREKGKIVWESRQRERETRREKAIEGYYIHQRPKTYLNKMGEDYNEARHI